MFKWSNSYATGIDEIDKQHERLFEIGAGLYDTAALNDDYDHYDEIMQVLGELTDYTIYHFHCEEELMKKASYEGLENQEVEHDFFVKKLQRLSKKDLEQGQKDMLMQLVAFLADWISGHILESDMKYVECLKRGLA